jgi:hypothetical protein
MILEKNKRLVAIVVPMSNRVKLTPEEEISKRQLIHHLNHYDKFMLVPESFEVEFPGFKNIHLNQKYFGSLEAHNRLLLSEIYYEIFSKYEFILVYHLDSLVFSDQSNGVKKDLTSLEHHGLSTKMLLTTGIRHMKGRLGMEDFV